MNELERIWKKVAMTFPGGTGENHEKSQNDLLWTEKSQTSLGKLDI
jgi:hypothetical protein